MDQAGAEVAVVGVGVYGDALEESAIVLAYGNELLGLGKLGELQNLGFGERRQAKVCALRRGQEGIHDLRILFIKNRAGGIDELAAGSHTRGRFLEHRQLQAGQLSPNVLLSQTPRYLRVTAHSAGARARGIDKHCIEQNGFTKHGIERREDRIELACITRDGTNALDTRLMQAREILVTLAIVQIECSVLTVVAGTLSLAHHHIRLGTTTGANL